MLFVCQCMALSTTYRTHRANKVADMLARGNTPIKMPPRGGPPKRIRWVGGSVAGSHAIQSFLFMLYNLVLTLCVCGWCVCCSRNVSEGNVDSTNVSEDEGNVEGGDEQTPLIGT